MLRCSVQVLTVLALTLCVAGCGRSPGETAKAYYVALDNGDKEALLECIPPDERAMLQHGPRGDQFVRIMQEAIAKMGGIDSVEIVDEQVEGESATVELKITFGDGTSFTTPVALKEVNKTWYVGQ